VGLDVGELLVELRLDLLEESLGLRVTGENVGREVPEGGELRGNGVTNRVGVPDTVLDGVCGTSAGDLRGRGEQMTAGTIQRVQQFVACHQAHPLPTLVGDLALGVTAASVHLVATAAANGSSGRGKEQRGKESGGDHDDQARLVAGR